MTTPLIGMPQGAEWLVILAIVILVFGAAKLPDLARNSGQALRIFKSETRGLRDDEKGDKDTEDAKDSTDAAPATPTAELPASEPVTPAQPEVPRTESQTDKNQA
jgi:sec-independent protein translocase protein TatA